jgi:hypothetical protein
MSRPQRPGSVRSLSPAIVVLRLAPVSRGAVHRPGTFRALPAGRSLRPRARRTATRPASTPRARANTSRSTLTSTAGGGREGPQHRPGRRPSKDFYWASGKAPKGLVYGEECLGKGGKMVCHRYGREGRLTVSPALGLQVPRHLPPSREPNQGPRPPPPQLSRYEKVVIVQDMDEPGLKAGQKVARMLPPGKAYLAKLPYKDANETFLKASAEALINAIHNAPPSGRTGSWTRTTWTASSSTRRSGATPSPTSL